MKKNALRTTALFLLFTLLFPARIAAQPAEPDGTAAELSEKFAYLAEADLFAEPDISETARQAELPEPGTYCEGELLVKMERSVSLQSDGSAFPDYVQDCAFLFSVENGENALRLQSENAGDCAWYRLVLREGTNFLSAWREIETLENVVFVQPNYLYTAQDTTENIMDADPYIHAQTWLDRISAVDAWEQGANIGEGVVVAVLDSGVDLDHPDLAGNLVTGYDFVDNDSVPDDENGHGTHVAGIIAACNNDLGVRGVAYGAKIMPVRVLGANGGGSSDTISEGIRYAAENGADIINLSLGGIGRDQMEADAIKTARGMGCLVVASAGNSNLPTTLSDGETYGGVFCSPAGLPGVLTVMAADEEGELVSFSNYDTDPDAGAEYEIMAPGVSILSTTMDGGYGYMDGTSMACPVVAGAAAVLMGMGCDADSAFQIIASCAEADAGRVDYEYPLLDLEACVERAKETTTFNTDPVITNCSVMASLADIDFGHGSVCFDAMNTTSHVYYYNGAFKSALSFSFENIGGSGDVTITGSVGGCPIDSRKCSVELGGEENGCVLEFSGTPAVDSDGDVEIRLYANGVEIYHGWMAAYDLKTLPTDAFYYYPPEPDYGINFWMAGLQKSTLTLSGSASKGTVWVIDAITFIPADCTLFFERQNGEKSCVIYEADGQFLMTSHDDTTGADGQLVFNGADLIGEKNFWASSSGTTIEIYGCNVYDPYILGISYAAQNAFLSNTFYPPELQGNSIYISGFYNCYGLQVDCNYFWGNMVNGCVYSEITAHQCISNNTFVENFASIIESTLKCYAPDYAGANVGFYDNCVIGPIEVYQVDSPSTLAEVYQVYHQSVGTTNEWGNSVLPTDETDKVCCASTSTVTEDVSTMESWGIHLRTPAFVTGMETLGYEVDTENDSAINYHLRFYFSAPAILPTWASFYSYSDDMTGTAAKYLSDDGTYCDVYGTTVNNGMDTEHWYRLSGYYQYSMELDGMIYYLWNTAMHNQSSYRYPVCCDDWYYNSMLDMLTVSGDRDGRTLTWSDGRITAAYRAEILRSVNGGEYVRLADNISGSQYVDSTPMESDTLLNYKVVLTGNGVKTLRGTATYLISLPDADQGVDLQLGAFYAQDSNTLSLRTAGKVVIDDCLSFRFPGLDATSVTFGEQVAASGIAYGAASDDEGTTVYLGSGDSAILDGGETLFTLGVTGADGEITVSATNGDAEQEWGKMDSVSYAAIEDGSGEVRKLWSSGNIFLARYNADGKLLGIEKLSGAYTMERPQSGRETVFCLSDGLIPQGEPITSGGIS